MKKGIVYVLSNPAFDNYVKVGKTERDIEARMRDLDNTSVPLPFRCEYAREVEDMNKIEQALHDGFADVRVRSRREFFEISAQRIIAVLKAFPGKDVTPGDDTAEDEEGVEALEKAIAKQTKRSRSTFSEARVEIGDVLIFARDESKTARVVEGEKVEFEGQIMSLSKSAHKLLREQGIMWKRVNGWQHWTKNGETLYDRVLRFSDTSDSSDEDDED